MFLKCRERRKDGKVHRNWSIVESRRYADGKVAHRHVLYLGVDTLYRCHDLLLEHKEALFSHLRERWADLFGARYEVLLYDLTSTYFECDVPEDPKDPRKFGYSRDRRSDCVQVIVALVVTPEGLPLAYEMMPGNTTDKTTLRDMLAKIGQRQGQAERIWFQVATRSAPAGAGGRPCSLAAALARAGGRARPSGFGSWTGASRPRKSSARCARARPQCTTWWAPPRAGSASSSPPWRSDRGWR